MSEPLTKDKIHRVKIGTTTTNVEVVCLIDVASAVRLLREKLRTEPVLREHQYRLTKKRVCQIIDGVFVGVEDEKKKA